MYLIIMGPPGAGKGTQASFITKEYEIAHISTGDMFRQAIKNETPLGIKVKQIIAKGELVPDELTTKLVEERLSQKDCKKGFLLDGYPRNIKQAEDLNQILNNLNIKLDVALNIDVADDIIIERIAGRRICKTCQASYHIKYNPPKKDGICDFDGGQLYQRNDDKEDVIKNRLKVYYEQTYPLFEYYKKENILKNVNGNQSLDNVFNDIKSVLGELK